MGRPPPHIWQGRDPRLPKSSPVIYCLAFALCACLWHGKNCSQESLCFCLSVCMSLSVCLLLFVCSFLSSPQPGQRMGQSGPYVVQHVVPASLCWLGCRPICVSVSLSVCMSASLCDSFYIPLPRVSLV